MQHMFFKKNSAFNRRLFNNFFCGLSRFMALSPFVPKSNSKFEILFVKIFNLKLKNNSNAFSYYRKNQILSQKTSLMFLQTILLLVLCKCWIDKGLQKCENKSHSGRCFKRVSSTGVFLWNLVFQFGHLVIWTYITSCSSVSIVNFEHVIAGWVVYMVPLHWGAILTYDCNLRNFTGWLFLILYIGKYELTLPML